MNKHEEAIQKLDFMNDEYNKLLERYKLSGGFGNWYLGVKKVLKEAEHTEQELALYRQFVNVLNIKIIDDSAEDGFEFQVLITENQYQDMYILNKSILTLFKQIQDLRSE